MLSRIAEALFWIGRYVERADDTARILDVHLQMLLEDPQLSEEEACRGLLAVMGLPAPAGLPGPTRDDVLRTLAYDVTQNGSIAGSLHAARENARRARETISAELWECLNTSWLNYEATRRRVGTWHHVFDWVRERAALVAGVADQTMRHDDAWRFMVLGRALERADMTARMVATSAIAGPVPSWPLLLRSCGAYGSYVRTYRGSVDDADAAEFLLRDPLFPRSVVFALAKAEECLAGVDPDHDGPAVRDRARRALGHARTNLEYRTLEEILVDLPAEMETVQQACSAACEAVARRYFPRAVTTSWVEEAS